MSHDTDELADELRRSLTAETGGAGEHPEPETLLAYAAGGLDATAENAVRRHLVVCAECRALLLDAESFEPEAHATGWAALRQRLPAPNPANVVPLRRPRRLPPLPLLAAAALAVLALGLGGWVASLERTVAELSRPQLNAPVLDLFQASAQRGKTGSSDAFELAPGVRWITLILNPVGEPGDAVYSAELVSPSGETIALGDGLRANRLGSLTLIVARRGLGTGEHRLRLYRQEDAGRQLVEEYPLWLREP